MTREFWYRGKEINKGKWVEGYYTYYPNGFYKKGSPEGIICDTRKQMIKIYFIDTETVSQDTSKIDNMGYSIFEWDIVTIDSEEGFFVVEWDCESAKFVMSSNNETFDFDSCWNGEIKIVGNIFDNPELLKGDKNE